jgi:sulfite reductase alpha subunit
MLDQLESGPWPSFVSDLKELANIARKQHPKSITRPRSMWWTTFSDCSSSRISMAAPTGSTAASSACSDAAASSAVTATCRRSSRRGPFPHHARRQPGGKFYTAKYLRDLCDLWDLRGSGVTNMHGSTGDIVFLGTTTPQLEEIFFELTHKLNQDLGGSGSNLRTPSDCIGTARCEYSCYDTQALCFTLTNDYQDELHCPAFRTSSNSPDGCPNPRVAPSPAPTWLSSARGATTSASIRKRFTATSAANSSECRRLQRPQLGKFDIQKEVIHLCPRMHGWKARSSRSTARVQPLHALHQRHARALRIGEDRGLSILVGAKAPFSTAPRWIQPVPFVKVEEPTKRLRKSSRRSGIGGWKRARIASLAELIKRQGFQKILK